MSANSSTSWCGSTSSKIPVRTTGPHFTNCSRRMPRFGWPMPKTDLDALIAREQMFFRTIEAGVPVELLLVGSGPVRELRFRWRGQIDKATRRSAELRLLPLAAARGREFLEWRRVWLVLG